MAISDDLLSVERSGLVRHSERGEILSYTDQSDAAVDSKESARDFVRSIEDFLRYKAQALAAARRGMGISEGLVKQDLEAWRLSGSHVQSKLQAAMARKTLIHTSENDQ